MSQTADNLLAEPLDYGRGGSDKVLGLERQSWMKIGIIFALFVGVFRFNFVRLWEKTNPFYGEPNWGHAFCVPLIGLYYLYLNREALLKNPVKPLLWQNFLRPGRLWVGCGIFLAGVLFFAACNIVRHSMVGQRMGEGIALLGLLIVAVDWGMANLIFGLLLFGASIWPIQNDFLKDVGMIWALFGLIVLLCGWDIMKIAWFPIAFMICAIPWPQLVYSQIAWPLQELAAKVAVTVLQWTHVAAQYSGSKIYIGVGDEMRTLNVAEACAGLRSLMTFISIAAAIAFLSNRALWQKIIICASAIPIAIFCNVMRVAGQGLLDHYVSQKLSESFAHQFVGLIMLIPAFFLILLVGWFLDNLFLETADVRSLTRRKKEATDKKAREELVIEIGKKPTPPQAKAPAAAPTAKAAAAPARVAPSAPTLSPAPKVAPVAKPPIAAPTPVRVAASAPAPTAAQRVAPRAAPVAKSAPVPANGNPVVAKAAPAKPVVANTQPRPAAVASGNVAPAKPAAARPVAAKPQTPNDLAEATRRLTSARPPLSRPAPKPPTPVAQPQRKVAPAKNVQEEK